MKTNINKKSGVLLGLAAVTVLAALVIGCKTNVSSETSTVAVTSVTLNKSEVTLEQGTSEKLTETVLPAEATNKKVTWSSGNTTVATVGQDGTVQAKTVGEAIITVTSKDGGKTATCKVTVIPLQYSVIFSVEGSGGTLKAKADGVTETTTSPISVEKGKIVTFTAVPEADYAVDKWSVTPVGALQTGGTTGCTTATVKNTETTTVKVTFNPTNKTYTVGDVNFTMKGIAAVTDGTVGHADESNNAPHTVSLTSYRIGETEVTQELWEKVMSNNPSGFSSSPESGEDQGKRPVEQVNWYECIAFCNELTKQVAELGESQCVYSVEGHTYGTADATARKEPDMDMNKKGFRLPTEAEWEWAAKGGKDYKWSGTNVESELVNYAWYDANSNNKTHQVKLKSANGYGLYDMSGNVWEWCWDWYKDSTPAGGQDPTGASGDRRVHHGGSWLECANNACRGAYRSKSKPSNSYNYGGLRLVSRP